MNCWSVLKNHHKFDVLLKPPAPIPERNEQEEEHNADEDKKEVKKKKDLKRLMGGKRTKSMEERSAVEVNKTRVAEASLPAQKKNNRFEQEHNETLLINYNTSNSDPIVCEHIRRTPRRALNRRKAKKTITAMTPLLSPPLLLTRKQNSNDTRDESLARTLLTNL